VSHKTIAAALLTGVEAKAVDILAVLVLAILLLRLAIVVLLT